MGVVGLSWVGIMGRGTKKVENHCAGWTDRTKHVDSSPLAKK